MNQQKKTYRAFEAVNMILSDLGLTRESISTYKEYSLENGCYIRLRISNHGIYLQNWFNANKLKRALDHSLPKLNIGQNLAITFAPNQEECKELNKPFPPKKKMLRKLKLTWGIMLSHNSQLGTYAITLGDYQGTISLTSQKLYLLV